MALSLSYAQLFSFAVDYVNPDETAREPSNFTWTNLINIVKDAVLQKHGQWRKCVLEVNFSSANIFLLDKDSNVSTHLFTEYKKHIIQDEESLITLRFSEENWQLMMQNALERNTLLHLLECCKKDMSAEAAANSGKGLVGLDRTILRTGTLWQQGMLKYNAKERYLVLVPGKLLLFKNMDIHGKHVRYVTTLIGARIHMKHGLQFRIQAPRMKEEDMTAWIASFKQSVAIGDSMGEANHPDTYGSPYEESSPSTHAPRQRYSDLDNPRYQAAPAWAPYLEQPRVSGRELNLVRMEPSVHGALPWKVEPVPAFASFQGTAASQVPYNTRGDFSLNRTTPSKFQIDLSRESSPSRKKYSPQRQEQVGWMQYPSGLQGELSRQRSPSRFSLTTGGQVPQFLGGHSSESFLQTPTNQLQGDFKYHGEDLGGSPSQARPGVRSSFGNSRPSFPGAIGRPSRGSSLPPLPAMFDTVQQVSPPRGWQNQQQAQQRGRSLDSSSFQRHSNYEGAHQSAQFQGSRFNSPYRRSQGTESPNQHHQSYQAGRPSKYGSELPTSHQQGYQGGAVTVFKAPPGPFQGWSSYGQVHGNFGSTISMPYAGPPSMSGEEEGHRWPVG